MKVLSRLEVIVILFIRYTCLLMQISNQPITWQQLSASQRADPSGGLNPFTSGPSGPVGSDWAAWGETAQSARQSVAYWLFDSLFFQFVFLSIELFLNKILIEQILSQLCFTEDVFYFEV